MGAETKVGMMILPQDNTKRFVEPMIVMGAARADSPDFGEPGVYQSAREDTLRKGAGGG
jgi:hypothetical protein